jgi:hypothetical protein
VELLTLPTSGRFEPPQAASRGSHQIHDREDCRIGQRGEIRG